MTNMITSTILQDTLTFLKTEFDKKVNSSTLQTSINSINNTLATKMDSASYQEMTLTEGNADFDSIFSRYIWS